MTELLGLLVRLERETDWRKPCHDNLAIIYEGAGPHIGELRCARCDAHRGWLPKQAARTLRDVIALYGPPQEPPVISNYPTALVIDPPVLLENVNDGDQ